MAEGVHLGTAACARHDAALPAARPLGASSTRRQPRRRPASRRPPVAARRDIVPPLAGGARHDSVSSGTSSSSGIHWLASSTRSPRRPQVANTSATSRQDAGRTDGSLASICATNASKRTGHSGAATVTQGVPHDSGLRDVGGRTSGTGRLPRSACRSYTRDRRHRWPERVPRLPAIVPSHVVGGASR